MQTSIAEQQTDMRSRRGPIETRPLLEALEGRRMLSTVQLNVDGVSPFNAFTGVGFRYDPVASLTPVVDGKIDTDATHYTASIDWGDGHSSTGYIAKTGNASHPFLVKGIHTYTSSAQYTVKVTVTGPQSVKKTATTMTLNPVAMPDSRSNPITEPYSYSGAVALSDVQMSIQQVPSFASYTGIGFQRNPIALLYCTVNGTVDKTLSHYHAQVNWGDGNLWYPADLGLVTSNTSYPLIVKGNHIYNTAGQYKVTTYITGPDGQTGNVYTAIASVNDLPAPASKPPQAPPSLGSVKPVTAETLDVQQVNTINGSRNVYTNATVALLYGTYDGKADSTTGDYKVQVNWGDSPAWSTGTIVASGNSSYPLALRGSHTYNHTGVYQIVVRLTAPDGQTVDKQTAVADVYGPDLVGTAFTFKVPSDKTGATNGPLPDNVAFTASGYVQNVGTATAAISYTRLYLSKDRDIDPSKDLLLASVATPAIASGGSTQVKWSISRLPAGLSHTYYGGCYLGMVVDALKMVTEAVETNNRNRGDAIDRRPVTLWDTQANIWTTPQTWATQSAAQSWLTSQGFSAPVANVDTYWSRSINSTVWSRFNNQFMSAGSFRILASVIYDSAAGAYRVRGQGADSTYNPYGLPLVGVPNPRAAAQWGGNLSYAQQYSAHF